MSGGVGEDTSKVKVRATAGRCNASRSLWRGRAIQEHSREADPGRDKR